MNWNKIGPLSLSYSSYGLELLNGDEGVLKCKVHSSFVTNSNVTILLESPYGRSQAEDEVYRIGASNKPYMYQSYAGTTVPGPTATFLLLQSYCYIPTTTVLLLHSYCYIPTATLLLLQSYSTSLHLSASSSCCVGREARICTTCSANLLKLQLGSMTAGREGCES